MTLPLVYCIVSNVVVNATLSIQRLFNSITLNDKLCWIMPHILQQTRMRLRLLDDHGSGPVEEVLPSQKIVQFRMSSVQSAVNI